MFEMMIKLMIQTLVSGKHLEVEIKYPLFELINVTSINKKLKFLVNFKMIFCFLVIRTK